MCVMVGTSVFKHFDNDSLLLTIHLPASLLSTCTSAHAPACLSVYLHARLSVYPPACRPPACPPAHQLMHPPACCLPARLPSTCPCPSTCLSTRPSACLPVSSHTHPIACPPNHLPIHLPACTVKRKVCMTHMWCA